MVESVEEKTVELMGRTADAFSAFANKIETLATEYGPEVVDMALWVARIDALQVLSVTFLLVVLAVISALFVKPLNKWAKRVDPEFETPAPLLGYVAGLTSIVLGFIFILRVFDPWPWVGVIEPQLWIARHVLGL